MSRIRYFAFVAGPILAALIWPANAWPQDFAYFVSFSECSGLCRSALSNADVPQLPPLVHATRLSSGFGQRISPIFGTPEFHTGVDLAAPLGTAVRISTAGVIEESSRKGSYGLFVKIRHSDVFETVYAHLSALSTGINPGVMLQPGELIGYVGSTGLSTGPHLHFEERIRGVAINPICAAAPAVYKPASQTKPKAPRGVVARESRKRTKR